MFDVAFIYVTTRLEVLHFSSLQPMMVPFYLTLSFFNSETLCTSFLFLRRTEVKTKILRSSSTNTSLWNSLRSNSTVLKLEQLNSFCPFSTFCLFVLHLNDNLRIPKHYVLTQKGKDEQPVQEKLVFFLL